MHFAEEANSGGLHLAELASLRDDPPAITAVTSTDQHSQIPAAASRYTARAQQEGLDQLLQRRAATIELRQLERQCAALLKSIYELIK